MTSYWERPQLPEREPVSILYPWVQDLLLRQQGTLLAAIRGCDGVEKEDTTKTLMRAIRSMVLVPADEREVTQAGGFMSFNMADLMPAVNKFVKNCDHYPLHFVSHIMHAFEVIGYGHPNFDVSVKFYDAYKAIVNSLHLRPETYDDHRSRMNEDRIAQGKV